MSTDRARFDVSVLCINYIGGIGEELQRNGVAVECIPQARGTNYLAPLGIARALKTSRPDVVHTHNTQAFIEGSIGARLAGVKRVIHTDHARLFPDKRRYVLAERMVSGLVERVVGVSDHTVAQLERYVGIPRRKLTAIPNGIVPTDYDIRIDAAAKRRQLGIPDEALVVGIGARLAEQKGHGVLLDAVAQVAPRFPQLLVLICGEGHLEEKLRRQAADLGIERHVRFMGVRRDMPELLQVFDAYVLPSYWEGLPMALLEAMAAGCPIIASAVGGVPMAVENGRTGITITAGSVDELAAAFDTMLSDEALRSRFANAARDRFFERFSADRMANAYEDLYAGAAA